MTLTYLLNRHQPSATRHYQLAHTAHNDDYDYASYDLSSWEEHCILGTTLYGGLTELSFRSCSIKKQADDFFFYYPLTAASMVVGKHNFASRSRHNTPVITNDWVFSHQRTANTLIEIHCRSYLSEFHMVLYTVFPETFVQVVRADRYI